VLKQSSFAEFVSFGWLMSTPIAMSRFGCGVAGVMVPVGEGVPVFAG
jgi:hypothetical protein